MQLYNTGLKESHTEPTGSVLYMLCFVKKKKSNDYSNSFSRLRSVVTGTSRNTRGHAITMLHQQRPLLDTLMEDYRIWFSDA